MNYILLALAITTCLVSAYFSQNFFDYLLDRLWRQRRFYDLQSFNKKEKAVKQFCTAFFLIIWAILFLSFYSILNY